MNELMQALLQVQNPNIQDMPNAPVTAEGWANYGKGLPAGIAGIPGDLAGLAGALMDAKRGIPVQALDFDFEYGTDALGRAMGADVESPQFMFGSIGLPGIEDLAKGGLLAKAMSLFAVKQGRGTKGLKKFFNPSGEAWGTTDPETAKLFAGKKETHYFFC